MFRLSFFWVYFISSSLSLRKEDWVSESYQAVTDLLSQTCRIGSDGCMHVCMNGNIRRGLLWYVVFVRMSSSFLINVDNFFPSSRMLSFLRGLITSISGLADIEWNVAIFDHVLDLSSHYPSQQPYLNLVTLSDREGTY